MHHLMRQSSSSPKTRDELKSLFQKLILLSQGSAYSISYVKKRSDSDEDDNEEENLDDKVNLAPTFFAHIKYTMLNNNSTGGEAATVANNDTVWSIKTSILYHSNCNSCVEKMEEEVLAL